MMIPLKNQTRRAIVPSAETLAYFQKLSQSVGGASLPLNSPPRPSYKPFHLMTFVPNAWPSVSVKFNAPRLASAKMGASAGTLERKETFATQESALVGAITGFTDVVESKRRPQRSSPVSAETSSSPARESTKRLEVGFLSSGENKSANAPVQSVTPHAAIGTNAAQYSALVAPSPPRRQATSSPRPKQPNLLKHASTTTFAS
mmetsp:Transcript_93717/g.264538  ORF Transcript_93717/g.264538 Transcript_93717/m.264538 type:complete len:203 (+) Transcript_93717:220-828(+)